MSKYIEHVRMLLIARLCDEHDSPEIDRLIVYALQANTYNALRSVYNQAYFEHDDFIHDLHATRTHRHDAFFELIVCDDIETSDVCDHTCDVLVSFIDNLITRHDAIDALQRTRRDTPPAHERIDTSYTFHVNRSHGSDADE